MDTEGRGARAWMRWIRSNVRLGSSCALFALAIQFVLLFGHVHPADTAWRLRSLQLSALSTDVASAAVPDAPSAPSKPVGLTFDYCAVCAVMNLAASVIPAATPGLLVPVALGRVPFQKIPDVSFAGSLHLLFRARAPPLA